MSATIVPHRPNLIGKDCSINPIDDPIDTIGCAVEAANFLKEHQVYDKAYRAIDLSRSENFIELVRAVNRETGMPLPV